MKSALSFILLIACAAPLLLAQEPEYADAKFKVSGNCNSCKTRIEKAVKISEVKSASWDKKTKMITVVYQPSAISVDSLQHRIALVGHDTEKYKAPDEVYDALPGCCLYRDSASAH
jgi:hypothetical protein